MQVFVIRHTAPDVEQGYCYGQSDLSLKDSFEEEYAALIEKVPAGADIIYSSPLLRCKILAHRLSADLNILVKEDDRLKELNFGRWEMKKWDDINPAELNPWMEDFENAICPEGESYRQLADRVELFITDLKRADYASAIIVTHAGVIKAIHAILNKVSLRVAMSLKIAYGEVILFSSENDSIKEESPDYYFENGFMVFTAQYHLKRGHCCKNGCRHCPYGFKKNKV